MEGTKCSKKWRDILNSSRNDPPQVFDESSHIQNLVLGFTWNQSTASWEKPENTKQGEKSCVIPKPLQGKDRTPRMIQLKVMM